MTSFFSYIFISFFFFTPLQASDIAWVRDRLNSSSISSPSDQLSYLTRLWHQEKPKDIPSLEALTKAYWADFYTTER